MVPLFRRNQTEFLLILELHFVYQRHHHRLQLWIAYLIQPSYLQRYINPVAGKGAPLCNYFDFVDETNARILK